MSAAADFSSSAHAIQRKENTVFLQVPLLKSWDLLFLIGLNWVHIHL